MFGVQGLVFRQFLRIPVDKYFTFLLSGLLPWIFIVQSMEMCTSIFVTHSQVLKSFHLKPLVLLFAQLLDNLINFLAAFCLIFVFLLLRLEPGTESLRGLLFVPLAVAVLLVGVMGICWLLATSQVFLRDTRFMVQFGSAVMFFLTPIFYPREMVPAEFRWLSDLNPVYRLIEPFRIAVYDFRWESFQASLVKGALVASCFVLAASLLWYRRRSSLYVHL
jgi:ABC-type polysaccharide/polyol phosphate export permease